MQAAYQRNLSTGQEARGGALGFLSAMAQQTAHATLHRRLTLEPETADERLYPYTDKKEAIGGYLIGSVSPRTLNRDAMEQRAQREGDEKLTSPQRVYRKVFRERAEMAAAVAKTWKGASFDQTTKVAFTIKAEVERARAIARKQHPGGGEAYFRAAYIEEAKVAARRSRYKIDIAKLTAAAETMTEAELRDAKNWFETHVWEDLYLKRIRDIRKALEANGVVLDG